MSTVIEFEDEPVWGPLERVARLSRQSSHLPSFHEAEFMFMGTARDPMTGLAIHLYKHRDTRRYLNLDDAGQAHAYCGSDSTGDNGVLGGWYYPYVSLIDAIEEVEFSLFDIEPCLVRSFPPQKWPVDDASKA